MTCWIYYTKKKKAAKKEKLLFVPFCVTKCINTDSPRLERTLIYKLHSHLTYRLYVERTVIWFAVQLSFTNKKYN